MVHHYTNPGGDFLLTWQPSYDNQFDFIWSERDRLNSHKIAQTLRTLKLTYATNCYVYAQAITVSGVYNVKCVFKAVELDDLSAWKLLMAHYIVNKNLLRNWNCVPYVITIGIGLNLI